MLIDTDVIIWYMKGNQNAYNALENTKNFFISVVTYMELVQGMRDKSELNHLRKALHAWNTKILYISEEISVKTMFFVEQRFFKPCHSTGGCVDCCYGNFPRGPDSDRK